jgi:transcriptional regulator with XRE-family HTH domain
VNPYAPQVRHAYRRSGLTIEKWAARAGVSQNSILNVMRGRNVTLEILTSACAAVGLVVEVRATDCADKPGD